ncbi:PRD domain-containing protein [Clostridium sp. KNHs214]|uniref:PRD domain-containing protein n=1 Tax=Clostridium sp. KNHs214 TaxID=1540257 RepID=UPI00054E1057|nr:PRD domain-containing protein [Clostridium sp. KNHs214]
MKIIKVFNNNIVATVTKDKTEMVVTGSGIGFQKRAGDAIDEKKIEKKYIIDTSDKYKKNPMLQKISLEYLEISHKIYEKALKVVGPKLGSQMVIALTDHISFAIEREKKNIKIPNLLLPEIQTLYKQEYEIGLWAIDYIEEKTGVKFSKDEAGYIAMHIVNSSTEGNNGVAEEIINITKGILNIIETSFVLSFNKDDYIRLNTHLKYLAKRIISNELIKDISIDEKFYEFALHKNKNMKQCIERIKNFIFDNYGYELSKQEIFYVMIHIIKVIA